MHYELAMFIPQVAEKDTPWLVDAAEERSL